MNRLRLGLIGVSLAAVVGTSATAAQAASVGHAHRDLSTGVSTGADSLPSVPQPPGIISNPLAEAPGLVSSTCDLPADAAQLPVVGSAVGNTTAEMGAAAYGADIFTGGALRRIQRELSATAESLSGTQATVQDVSGLSVPLAETAKAVSNCGLGTTSNWPR